MRTKDEIIKGFSDEFDALCQEYENEPDPEESTEDIELFSEYKVLIEDFLFRVTDSDYDADEYMGCFRGMAGLCIARLQKIESILEDNYAEFTDDMTNDEMLTIVCNQLKTLKKGSTAVFLKMKLLNAFQSVTLPNKSELEAMLDKLASIEEDGIEYVDVLMDEEDENDSFCFDLGCTISDMKLLEGLMGELPEFDEYLRS